MRLSLVLIMMLLPLTGSAQVELGPFRFLNDSKAQALTGGLILLGPSPFGASVELASPQLLSFLNFIPGQAVKVTVAAPDGVLVQAAVISRARYMPQRKIIGWVGIALSLDVAKNANFGAGIVLGADYLLTDKYVVSVGALGGGLMISIGLHRDFGW